MNKPMKQLNANTNSGFINAVLYGLVGFLSAGLVFNSILPLGDSDYSAAQDKDSSSVAAEENELLREDVFSDSDALSTTDFPPYTQSPAFGPVTIEQRLRALELEQAQAKSEDIVTRHPEYGAISGFPLDEEQRAIDLAKQVRESIVQITGMKVNSGFGTGWLIAPDVVVTNEHVANHDESYYGDIAVRTIDGTIIAAEVLSMDSYRDIAILKLEEPLDRPVLRLTDSLVEVGEPVIAVGHPDRIGNWATMAGVVTDNKFYDGEAILTSLPTSSGASGSPILNLDGEVVGIVAGIYWGTSDPGLRPAEEDVVVHTFLPRVNIAGGSNHIMLRNLFANNGVDYK